MAMSKETALQLLKLCLKSMNKRGVQATYRVVKGAGAAYQKKFNETFLEAIQIGAEALEREIGREKG